MKFSRYLGLATLLGSATALTPLIAQTVDDETQPQASLAIPEGQLFARNDPNVRRASARVNGEIITGTDIDHRLGLLVQGNQEKIPAEDLAQLRMQVLAALIDETLKTQAATVDEMEVKQEEIEAYYKRAAENQFKRSVAETDQLLTSWGSSPNSYKRQIRGDIAWSRLISRHIRPGAQVSDEDIKIQIERREAEKGTVMYDLEEIFFSGTPDQQEVLLEKAKRVFAELEKGAPFGKIAARVSETTTRIREGSLGPVKADRLPPEMATAVQSMKVNEVVVVPAPGGISMIHLVDKYQIGVVDPRDAVLSLKQIAINFSEPMPEAQFRPLQLKFNEATSKINGCGPADEAAKALNAEVVNRDDMRIRDLPPPLQEVMLQLQIGQSTPAYGSPQDGLRTFVLCGRDLPETPGTLNVEAERERQEEDRVNKRARTYLRDLRRDAIIEYN